MTLAKITHSSKLWYMLFIAVVSLGFIAFFSLRTNAAGDTTPPTIYPITTTNGVEPYVLGNSPGYRIRMDVVDGESGIDPNSCEYTINNGSTWEVAEYTGTRCRGTSILGNDGEVITANMRVSDLDGNQSVGTAVTRYVDALPPTANTPTANPLHNNYTTASPTLSATATDTVSPLYSCQYLIENAGSGAVIQNWTAGTLTNGGGLSATCVAQPASISDGTTFTVTFSFRDSVAHEAQSNANFTVDATPPHLVLVDGVSSNQVDSDTIQITASDLHLDATSLQYGFTSGTCGSGVSFSNSFSSGSSFTLSDYTKNGLYLCIKASDLVGNTSYLKSSNTIAITEPDSNSTGPLIVQLYADSGAINSGGSIIATENQDFSVGATVSTQGNIPRPFTFIFSQACSGETSTGKVFAISDNINLPSGEYICVVNVTDANGNISSASVSIVVEPQGSVQGESVEEEDAFVLGDKRERIALDPAITSFRYADDGAPIVPTIAETSEAARALPGNWILTLFLILLSIVAALFIVKRRKEEDPQLETMYQSPYVS